MILGDSDVENISREYLDKVLSFSDCVFPLCSAFRRGQTVSGSTGGGIALARFDHPLYGLSSIPHTRSLVLIVYKLTL